MRILTLTNLYPNPFQPHRATFNRNQLRILGERHPVRVIAPIAWTDELKARRQGQPALPAGRRRIFRAICSPRRFSERPTDVLIWLRSAPPSLGRSTRFSPTSFMPPGPIPTAGRQPNLGGFTAFPS
jgi:hypothetical protein